MCPIINSSDESLLEGKKLLHGMSKREIVRKVESWIEKADEHGE